MPVNPKRLYASLTGVHHAKCVSRHLLAFTIGVVGEVKADHAEDAALAMVKKFGGTVVRNEQLPNQPVISVMLSLSACKDADLKELVGFKALTYLALYRTAVTDAGLKEVAKLKSLQTLDVMKTKITDAGLKELVPLKSLERLAHGCRIR